MRSKSFTIALILLGMLIVNPSKAQQDDSAVNVQHSFWDHVQFGGAFGLGFSSDYTEIVLSPDAIYNFNRYFALGVGIQYSYTSSKNEFTSSLYGANTIALFNPIQQIQLSLSLTQSWVDNTYKFYPGAELTDQFWLTGLYAGIGYRTGNVTVGMNYNLLYNEERDMNSNAFTPFIRVYF